MKTVDRAFDILKRTVRTRPVGNDARIKLISKLRMYDQVDEAIKVCHEGGEYLHRRADVFIELGKCYEYKADFEEAKTQYQKALEITPTSAGTHMALALVLGILGDSDEALKMGEKAISLEPGSTWNKKDYATILRHAGQSKQSIDYLKKLISRHRRSAFLVAALARASAAAGDFETTHTSIDKALSLSPKILRYWHMAFQYAGLAESKTRLAKILSAFKQLPPESGPFGQRLLRESQLLHDAFSHLLAGNNDEAEAFVMQGLEDARRNDAFACTMVCLLARLQILRGDVASATNLLKRKPVGPHQTTICKEPDCPDVAAARRQLNTYSEKSLT